MWNFLTECSIRFTHLVLHMTSLGCALTLGYMVCGGSEGKRRLLPANHPSSIHPIQRLATRRKPPSVTVYRFGVYWFRRLERITRLMCIKMDFKKIASGAGTLFSRAKQVGFVAQGPSQSTGCNSGDILAIFFPDNGGWLANGCHIWCGRAVWRPPLPRFYPF